ncbi:MAG: efflux RND transporter periplasmic adaptor subunit [bacterium]
MKNLIWIIIFISLIGGLIGWRLTQKQLEKQTQSGQSKSRSRMPVSVELKSSEYRDIISSYQVTGSVEAIQNVKISPKITGRISYITVNDGDVIKQGQKLVVIDQPDIEAQVNQQKAFLAAAKYKLAQGKADDASSRSSLDSQIQQQEGALLEAKSRYKQAELGQSSTDTSVTSQIAQQEAALKEAKSRYEQAKLGQSTNDSSVTTQIAQQKANLASAKADLNQVVQSKEAQLETIRAQQEDAKNKIDSAQAQVSNAKVQIKGAQVNLDNTTAKLSRKEALLKKGYIAEQDVEDTRSTVSTAQSQFDTAQGQLLTANAALNSANAQKRAADQQAIVTKNKLDADIEAAKAKVDQVAAALEYAQANIPSTPAYVQNLEALQAKINQAQAALDYAKSNISNTPAYKQNMEALRAKVDQATAALKYARDNKTAQNNASRENLLALQSAVDAAKASLDNITAKLADSVLYSPLSGVITDRSMDIGGMASPGQPILTIQAMNKVYVVVSVPEDVFVKLQINQPADVTFDSMPDKKFTANIAQLNPAADPQSRQFTVKVILDNKDKKISAGMFGKVNLQTGKALHALSVPLEAIDDDVDGSKFVIKAVQKDKDLLAAKTTVTAGVSDDKWVEITNGLDIKDKVVTMSATVVRDGQKISRGREKKKDDKVGKPSMVTPGEHKKDQPGEKPATSDTEPSKVKSKPADSSK